MPIVLATAKPVPTSSRSGKGRPRLWAAFRQAEEVVGLLAIGLRLQVLVAVTTDGNDHLCNVSTSTHIEGPLPALDPGNGVLLAESPRSPVAITSTD